MQCYNCNFTNPSGLNFCGLCGTALTKPCAHCHVKNPLNFNYCGHCGEPFPQSIVNNTPQSSTPHPPSNEAERRHLTVMFCDLVGSTPLSEQLDPEDFREVVRAYQQASVDAILPYDGYVAQYLGDGLLLYFGYPIAHEDDARRAVKAGLAILAAIEQLNDTLQTEWGITLAIRIGIHTGLVVVGDIGGQSRPERLAMGEVTNIAARLQHFASPNQLVISAALYQIVTGFFECQTLGTHHLKGLHDTLGIYQVLRESGARTRLDVGQSVGLTALVGRDEEIDLLLTQWEQAEKGQGQVVLIMGEAGIGKSRLGQAFQAQLSKRPHRWFETRCSSYHQHSFLYPITELLQRQLQQRQTDTKQDALQSLAMMLKDYELSLSDLMPIFAMLLSLPIPEPYRNFEQMSPQLRKQKTLTALLNLFLEAARQNPLVLLIEDIHWIDPTSLALLTLAIEQVATAPILLILTARPTFQAPWERRAYITQLDLQRLTQSHIEAIIQDVTGGKSLPSALVTQIITKTDGVPLFVEELTRMVLTMGMLRETESGYALTEPLPNLNIPTTLHDLLMARLDQLTDGRDVAQVGAIIGREFTFSLLQAITKTDETQLRNDLTKLAEVDLLYQQGILPDSTYLFKHALIQEVAYRSLLRRKRRGYHQKIAETLESQYPTIVETQPEVVAHHFTEAQRPQQAIPYWQRAGQRAIANSANEDAIQHLTKALALLTDLPETSERIHQQLACYILLGLPLLMTKGYAALAVERNYAKAKQLCQFVGETPQLFSVLFGLWTFYLNRADHHTTRRLGEQLLRIAKRFSKRQFLLQAYQVQGINSFYRGNFVAAREQLQEAINLYFASSNDTDNEVTPQDLYGGADHGIACLLHLALTLWMLGYPDQAQERISRAQTLAQSLQHPFSEALALCGQAWLAQWSRQPEQAQPWAKAAFKLSTEQGFAVWGALSLILQGWSLTELGQLEAGVQLMERGFAQHQATGAVLGEPHFMALLASAHHQQGQSEVALIALDKALQTTTQVAEKFYEAEIYRLKGEVLLKQANLEAALACFEQAITIAHQQQARAIALRVAISLVQAQPTAKNRAILQTIYAKFNEGFKQADWLAAKQLLS